MASQTVQTSIGSPDENLQMTGAPTHRRWITRDDPAQGFPTLPVVSGPPAMVQASVGSSGKNLQMTGAPTYGGEIAGDRSTEGIP